MPPFLGLTIVLSQVLSSAERKELMELVRQNGGMLADIVTKATSFVVSQATQQREGEEGVDEAAAKEHLVPGVTKDFLTESVDRHELQDMEAHLLWGEARRLSNHIEEKTTSRFKEKRGVKIDQDVGEELLKTAHMLVDRQA